MTALSDLREKIATARAIGEPFGMVVLTADEAQAVVDEVERPQPAGAHLRCERCGTERTIRFNYATASAPPHDGDDDVT